jgi:3'(2'), 5'-bisphosphate nucleotidase
MAYAQELAVALQAARTAAELLAEEYERFQRIPDAPSDITTEADRHSQEAILAYLLSVFPDDAYCAEENTPSLHRALRIGPRMWVIDPIDGTRGFARKNGEFSVMVGFIAEGQIRAGVVLEPAKGRVTYALQGSGCWRQDDGNEQPAKCQVSSTALMSAATLTQSHSKTQSVPSQPVRKLAPARVVETYSAGVKLALVARGEADLYVNTYSAFSDWDICAGHILVEEAGGAVSGLAGETLEYSGQPGGQRAGLLASNGLLHREAISRLKS